MLRTIVRNSSSNVLLPAGGLAIAAVGGWLVSRQDFAAEMNAGYPAPPWHGRLLPLFVRYVAPVCILLIFLNSLGLLGR